MSNADNRLNQSDSITKTGDGIEHGETRRAPSAGKPTLATCIISFDSFLFFYQFINHSKQTHNDIETISNCCKNETQVIQNQLSELGSKCNKRQARKVAYAEPQAKHNLQKLRSNVTQTVQNYRLGVFSCRGEFKTKVHL